ncbi:MAG TPA: hypothetical protein VJT70_04065 [Sphingomicrobium sp.]|nr:hypothetical protein [Sphingomicrobium sp.]
MSKRRTGLGIIVAASIAYAIPAASEDTGASLSVGATVEPTCLVSSEGRTASANVSCTSFGDGSFAVQAGTSAPIESATPAPAGEQSDTTGKNDVTYVTVTY